MEPGSSSRRSGTGTPAWRKGGRYVVEALGLNRWFVNASREAGFDIVVVDAVKLNLRVLGKKTDRRDAHELARRLPSARMRPPHTSVTSPSARGPRDRRGESAPGPRGRS